MISFKTYCMFDQESKSLIPGAGDNILNYDLQPSALGRHSKLTVH